MAKKEAEPASAPVARERSETRNVDSLVEQDRRAGVMRLSETLCCPMFVRLQLQKLDLLDGIWNRGVYRLAKKIRDGGLVGEGDKWLR